MGQLLWDSDDEAASERAAASDAHQATAVDQSTAVQTQVRQLQYRGPSLGISFHLRGEM
jgi:hypothetical protein